MSKSKTKPFDPAEYLDDSDAIAAYMSEALESGDPAFVADALGVVARAARDDEVAREAGVSRESLYRALRRMETRNSRPSCGWCERSDCSCQRLQRGVSNFRLGGAPNSRLGLCQEPPGARIRLAFLGPTCRVDTGDTR